MKVFSPFPGEYIASALKRGNELHGITNLSNDEFYIKPIPRRSGRPCKALETAQPAVQAHTRFDFPPFFTQHRIEKEVLRHHTLYPLNAALGRSWQISRVTPKTWNRICPDCIPEDNENYGSAFLHRGHLETSVKVCYIHGSNLLEICPECFIPVSKHEISKLGLCGLKYTRLSRQLKSREYQYSRFIAGLLNYTGEIVDRRTADWIVHTSTLVRYPNEVSNPDMRANMAKLIDFELGRAIKYSEYQKIPETKFALCAFIGCVTADTYLKIVHNEEARRKLKLKARIIRGFD